MKKKTDEPVKKKKSSKIKIPETALVTGTLKKPGDKSSKKNKGKTKRDKTENGINNRELLRILNEVKNGNFAVRMPVEGKGISGKICNTLNDIIALNENLNNELSLARNTISKQGNLNHRIELPRNAKGSWRSGVHSLNNLITDLVHPCIETAHVVSSVAHKSLKKQIEERKASEKKVKLLNKQLVENNTHLLSVNEELDRFAYVASHDLQEPLRKIMVFSDKILQKPNSVTLVDKYLKKIINSSQRMQSLINDVLQFSRQTINVEDFVKTDLTKLVKEAMLELEIEIEKNKVQVKIEGLPVIPVIPGLMRQLFYNLINNGIKFRKVDTAPVINIYSEKINTSKNKTCYYRISVTDNGIGFDPAYADQIFVIFKRLHSYHEFSGSGVGLSICKKIAEKHNGSIKAIGKLNEGSTFIIEIPEKQPIPAK